MKKVIAGGRFNTIHPGHIHFLKKAKSMGEFLIVVIANDKTILRQKKDLLLPAEKRKEMVERTGIPDLVLIGHEIPDEHGIIRIIKEQKPDVIALGYDQKIDESSIKQKTKNLGLSCEIKRISKLEGYETKNMLKNKNRKE
jgi:FAD synthetase